MSFDKYHYYVRAVQSPDEDVLFLSKTFKKFTGREAKIMGEDFCGTFKLCVEWIKLNKDHRSVAIDLSQEPLEWGQKNHLTELNNEQQSRIQVINSNVLDPNLPKIDLMAAMNFSYFLFKTRDELREYFKVVHSRLNDGGVIFADCFGGTDISDDVEEEIDHEDFLYFWHQEYFDPITNFAKFHIHFQVNGQPKLKSQFVYDWRMWSIPEIREIMTEAGFSKTRVLWEEEDSEGGGTGEFYETEKAESCAGWIAYVVGHK
jgi:cyclopropane fatty-acyl-phospholipid synthase-like methyltransferase